MSKGLQEIMKLVVLKSLSMELVIGASIRIPMQTANDGYGYLEDRRPSANMDPYLVAQH